MSRPEDEFTDDPPPRRRGDDEVPPRRRRDADDDYDDVAERIRRRPAKLTGMDGMFGNTSMVALILFGFCCGDIALILGIIGLCICKDEIARRNALIVTCISAVRVAVAVVFVIANAAVNK